MTTGSRQNTERNQRLLEFTENECTTYPNLQNTENGAKKKVHSTK